MAERIQATQELLGRIETEAALPPQVGAEDATAAVLCVLSQRLSGGEARHLVDNLPEPMKYLVQRCALHRDEPPAVFDANEFLRRVGAHFDMATEEALRLCRVVFDAIRPQLPDKEIRDIANQLPEDIQKLWHPPEAGALPASTGRPARTPVKGAPQPAPADAAVRAPLIAEIEQSGILPPGVTGAGALSSVLCTLALRLSRGEAVHLNESLPGALRPLVQACALHRQERGQVFNRIGMRQRVGRHLGVDERHAQRIIETVFAVVQQVLPDDVSQHVADQLPEDLRALWVEPRRRTSPPPPPRATRSAEPPPPRRLYRDIERLVALPAHVTAEDAAEAVLCVLSQRLSGTVAGRLLEGQPMAVRGLVAPCGAHREEPPSQMGREELVQRVAEHLKATTAEAEAITRGVFEAVQKGLPQRTIRDVTRQLPADLVALWQVSERGAPPREPGITGRGAVEAAPGPEPRDVEVSHPVIGDIERSGVLPAGITGGGALSAVMCVLSQRLSAGQAGHVLGELPEPVAGLFRACAIHRGEHGARFERPEFLRRVAVHLDIDDPRRAEAVARAVFAAVKRAIPEYEIDRVSSQLPRELDRLWRE